MGKSEIQWAERQIIKLVERRKRLDWRTAELRKLIPEGQKAPHALEDIIKEYEVELGEIASMLPILIQMAGGQS